MLSNVELDNGQGHRQDLGRLGSVKPQLFLEGESWESSAFRAHCVQKLARCEGSKGTGETLTSGSSRGRRERSQTGERTQASAPAENQSR